MVSVDDASISLWPIGREEEGKSSTLRCFFKTVGGNDDRDLLGRKMPYREKYVFVRPLDEKHPQFKNLDEEAGKLIARLLSTAPDY